MIRSEDLRWLKSSRSGSQSNCVEVAHTREAVRDSKNPDGDTLTFSRRAVAGFFTAIKDGQFDG